MENRARAYNILRSAALIWIPALGTLIFTLGSVWDWSFTENLIGSIMAFDTFLGALLGFGARNISTGGAAYAGHLVVDTDDPGRDKYTLDIHTPLDQLPDMSEVRLKVVPLQGSHE